MCGKASSGNKSVSVAETAKPVSAAETKALFADLKNLSALVLAISGGPDSTALLVLAARWRASLKNGPRLVAVTVDHGLRPESAREANDVKRFARKLKVAHRTLRWTGRKPATGLQAAARQARYHLLAQAAHDEGAQYVLTAHTRDDQAETVLMRLARGSGLAGLGAMSRMSPFPIDEAKHIFLVRPLLGVPKTRLVATLKAARIRFADDTSNRNPRFTRVRIRELMPTLAEEGLTVPRLVLLARRLARANATIERTVDAAFKALLRTNGPGPLVFDATGFRHMPEEIALRLLGRAVAQRGDEGQVELGKLEALHATMESELTPGPTRFRRTLAGAIVTLEGDRLVVERAPPRRLQTQHFPLLTKRKGAKRKVAKRRSDDARAR
jgi:tRNA(Ile)-lysidine synthase